MVKKKTEESDSMRVARAVSRWCKNSARRWPVGIRHEIEAMPAMYAMASVRVCSVCDISTGVIYASGESWAEVAQKLGIKV